ncbi:MAG: GNAT family N-acetyltransferase [Acidobacteriota bacterium]
MECRFLQAKDFSTLHKTYLKAFSDYIVKMQPTQEQLLEMMTRRGIDYDLSVGAFDNGELVGFNLNGIDEWNRSLTIYDISTGIIPEYRGRGITYQLFNFSLGRLKSSNAKQYILEVIETNEKAIRVYSKVGFKEVRKLACFILKLDRINRDKVAQIKLNYKIESQPDWELYKSFWDWQPSWQNSINSIKRSNENKVIISAWQNDNRIGYGVIYPATGDIPQFAIDKRYRRKGVGSNLMVELLKYLPSDKPARIINVDKLAQQTIDFYTSIGFENFINTKEMCLEIR